MNFYDLHSSPLTDLERAVPVKTEPAVNSDSLKRLSSREVNRAKRKARQNVKQKSAELDSSSADPPSSKRIKKEKEDVVVVDSVPDAAGMWSESARYWPFESFCDLLVSILYDPSWEVSLGCVEACVIDCASWLFVCGFCR